ncbi:MAG: hypothetical protein IJG02_01400 [Thermoguttaceae bacterium]|nr:hypothetical protein [Thermoguttaceae bacterium]
MSIPSDNPSDRPADRLSRRDFFLSTGSLCLLGAPLMLGASALSADDAPQAADPKAAFPDPVLGFEGVWERYLPGRGIILVDDQQLEDLAADPDREVNLSLNTNAQLTTLRKIREDAKKAGARTIVLAFDEFWKAYRTDVADQPRLLFPDSDRYIELTGRISNFLAEYDLGLELSLLSPLEIGGRFAEATGQTGRWVQFREGWRDPVSGRFDIALWEHRSWKNNKGVIHPERTEVRLFAFREKPSISRQLFYPVAEEEIIELSVPYEVTSDEGNTPLVRISITGQGHDNPAGADLTGYDRIMAVVSYKTPEMDYFSPEARPFLETLVTKYHDAGIRLNALYADEIHIQQDWAYHNHQEAGQFSLRYLSEGMISAFAEKYGEKYRDFQKYLVYFLAAPHDFSNSVEATVPAQHIPEAGGVREAWLLRRRYFDLLHKTVVDLFAGAKKFAESLYGHKLTARAHATWAQSPTIDRWRGDQQSRYEYTSDFLWSNTVHQAAAACDDYFRWNDYLTGGGNDHAEGGWSDRDYYGQALACSTGSLNDTPNAYAACWGLPAKAARRHHLIEAAYGNAPFEEMMGLEAGQHRDIEVLMLYPLSLVACRERFGSWMTQYGYANYITAEKLLQYGKIDQGAIDVRGRRYTTVCALYETIPPAGLLEFLQEFLSSGGRVIWSGPPALDDLDGTPIYDRWREIFGIESVEHAVLGLERPGRRVEFEGTLSEIEPQTILTDLPVDYIYPIHPAADASDGTEILARCDGQIVGWRRGQASYLGFRPRDDQSASLGYETRVWFDTLRLLGAYPDTKQPGDNPTVVSRQTPYLATTFPNGAVAVAKHYRRHRETWSGGFHRNADEDAKALENNPLDSNELELTDLTVAGKTIDYRGKEIVGFRCGDTGRPIAFYGEGTDRITIDGTPFIFTEQPYEKIAFFPVPEDRRVAGGALYEIRLTGPGGKVHLPIEGEFARPRLFHRLGLGSLGGERPATLEDGVLSFDDPQGAAAYYLLDDRSAS